MEFSYPGRFLARLFSSQFLRSQRPAKVTTYFKSSFVSDFLLRLFFFFNHFKNHTVVVSQLSITSRFKPKKNTKKNPTTYLNDCTLPPKLELEQNMKVDIIFFNHNETHVWNSLAKYLLFMTLCFFCFCFPRTFGLPGQFCHIRCFQCD